MTEKVFAKARATWRRPSWLPRLVTRIFADEFFGPQAPVETGPGTVKVWTGTAWVAKPVKVWTGSAWLQVPLKRWTGTNWF
jgi:hypothetical protein